MNKKAFYGLLLAVLIPLIGYIWVRNYGANVVEMPRHFIYDSVITQTKNGKEQIDTVWHKLPDIHLYNQLGKPVTWDSMKGKVVVADFFFTHCPSICPALTKNMKKLQDGIKNAEIVGNPEADFVQFLSFSIDPERDSVRALKQWADRFQINPYNWWLLTGDKKVIYDLSNHDLKLTAQDGGPVDSNFLHTDLMVLIDRDRTIRGYYHGLDTTALSRLSRDIVLLYLEKNPKEKSFLSGKLELLGIIFLITALGIVLLFTLLNKEKKGI